MVPQAELAATREELPREYWELAQRVLPGPHKIPHNVFYL